MFQGTVSYRLWKNKAPGNPGLFGILLVLIDQDLRRHEHRIVGSVVDDGRVGQEVAAGS